MTEPLNDKTLAKYAALPTFYDGGYGAPPPFDDAIRDLIAEVGRLKAELAEAIRFRDAYKRAKAENDDRYITERDEARNEVASLHAENATLREENARLLAALEAQGQAAFVAGMRAEAAADQNGVDEEEEAGAYCIDFDFDAKGDPPKVLIYDAEDGLAMMEIFEEPTCRHPSGWSWESEDWEPGPLAKEVLDMLNGEPEDEDDDE